jgi:D-alanyl-D-alanine endopeptidase (penicillin-binding protein 7)
MTYVKYYMKYFTLLLALLCPNVWADSHALYQYTTGEYIEGHEITTQRSIASITKLFTAITILNANQDLSENITVKCKNAGHVIRGSSMSRMDLMTAMIVSSDNCAAETLAFNYPGGFDKFIQDRNEFTQRHGLTNTQLSDATGLLETNVSTVNDLVRFTAIAYQNNVLRSISNLPNADVVSYKNGRKTVIHLRNTNPILTTHSNIVVSKTGTTAKAGKCVVMLVKKMENFYAVVILGEPNVQTRTRIAEKLLAYN